MKIAILIPTRARLDRFQRAVYSILRNEYHLGNCTIYAGLDQDDPAYTDYLKFCNSPQISVIAHAQRHNVPIIVDKLSRAAYEDQNDLFVIASDDIVCQTLHWDSKLMDYYQAVSDKLVVGYFNNGRDRELCEHFVVSKEWIKVLGYCVPTEFNHFYVDTYIADIAKRNNRLVWMKDICLKHEHFKYGLAPYDKIYARTRKNNFPAKDEAIYNLMLSRRITDANKIRDAICGLGS